MVNYDRFFHHPAYGLGKDGRRVTASPVHMALARKIAAEGTVLLKNDGTLPLAKGERICLFGRGAGEWLFGGGGSGDVRTPVQRGLAEALIDAEKKGELSLYRPLIDEARKAREEELKTLEAKEDYSSMKYYYDNFLLRDAFPVSEENYREAVAFGGTAILSIVRYSAEGTMEGDREPEEFEIHPNEKALLEKLTRDFERVVVVLNTCGPVNCTLFEENAGVNALLYPLYGGSYAGDGILDVLFGKVNPAAKLQHTLARELSDYPSTAGFFDHDDFVEYTEDIYMGYRYFETFAPEKVLYPFGFGLSYTSFAVTCEGVTRRGLQLTVKVKVENTGKRAGRQVAQLYLGAPAGKLGKAKKVLCAFAKTRELAPGAAQTLTLLVKLPDFASFDDTGKVAIDAFVLEAGDYILYLGENVRDSAPVYTAKLEKDRVVSRHEDLLSPLVPLTRRTLWGEETLPAGKEHPVARKIFMPDPEKDAPGDFCRAAETCEWDAILSGISDESLASLLYGHGDQGVGGTGYMGICNPQERKYYVPPVETCDGPAGLRTRYDTCVKTTHFPCGTTLAQSWDVALAEKFGKTAAREVKENNCGIWLAPGVNLHRSPLCGRNFEYMSEDPFTTGKMAGHVVRGVQSQSIAATVKHFAVNNREYDRLWLDSRASKRALRELYLKQFEILVKEFKPWCVMTSYNLINGRQASCNSETINGILKGEWGYEGLVMTDWCAFSSLEDDLVAGSDVKMPDCITRKRRPGTTRFDGVRDHFEVDPRALLKEGKLRREHVYDAARRLFNLFAKLGK
ncbi:MAG: glycoside hydrolase family 3 C-terminal domain-containing protein [Clostridia bacterium]|nr:glycoside hydrolase family 3 C-terminal domain-containing protein [Clostridia bacterium]